VTNKISYQFYFLLSRGPTRCRFVHVRSIKICRCVHKFTCHIGNYAKKKEKSVENHSPQPTSRRWRMAALGTVGVES
jgi:hypothetical protein